MGIICVRRVLGSTMPGLGLAAGRQLTIGGCLKGLRATSRGGKGRFAAGERIRGRARNAKDTEIFLDLVEGDGVEEEPEPPKYYDPERPDSVDTEGWKNYKIPHRFQGFNPQRMDLERLPRFRTNFDGKPGQLAWMGTQCAKCGLQIRKEKRTNKETSLNVYAHEGIPVDLLRSCPETKMYPLLWRTRDPFVALDVLGVDD